MYFYTRLVLVIISLALFSTVIKADPIKITSGIIDRESINIQGKNATNIAVSGFRIVIGYTSEYTYPLSNGNIVSPVINPFGVAGMQEERRGTVSFNGTTYNSVYLGGYLSSDFRLHTASITLPTVSMSQSQLTFTTQIPFTMTATVGGTNCIPNMNSGVCTNLPNIELTGNGTADITFRVIGTGDDIRAWTIQDFNFAFSAPTPEPIPEPATLLLMGTGLAGIIGFAKRRKKKPM